MRPVLIGLAGGSGSGKTTVTRAIISQLDPAMVAVIDQDSYYKDQSHLNLADRRLVNYDHPDAFDFELLLGHIEALLSEKAVEKPRYSFETYTRLEGFDLVEPKPVVIVEGIMVLVDKQLRDNLDIKLFVDADADVRFIRRVMRDVKERGRTLDSVIQQYMSVVRPMHLQFVEPSKRYADVIIPEGGHNSVAVELLVSRLKAIIA